jgi:hypothetical protein
MSCGHLHADPDGAVAERGADAARGHSSCFGVCFNLIVDRVSKRSGPSSQTEAATSVHSDNPDFSKNRSDDQIAAASECLPPNKGREQSI